MTSAIVGVLGKSVVQILDGGKGEAKEVERVRLVLFNVLVTEIEGSNDGRISAL